MADPKEQAELPDGAQLDESDPVGVDLPDQWKVSDGDDSPNLWQRMVIARQHMQYIKKTRQGTLQYATVNHDEVTVAAREALDKANVLSIPNVLMHEKSGNTTTCDVEVEFVNPDNPTERYSITMFGENNNPQDKGPGGAISYTTKYCYLKGLMCETGEKDSDEQDIDSGPSKEEQDQIERGEFYEWITNSIRTHELDPEYVRAQIKHRAKNANPTTKELAKFAKDIDEHPDQWRKPTRDEEE